MPKEPRDFHEEARRFDQRLALLKLMIDHDKARPGSDEDTTDDALIAEAKSSLMHDLFPFLHPEKSGDESPSPEDCCSAAAPEEETRVPLDLAIKLLRYTEAVSASVKANQKLFEGLRVAEIVAVPVSERARLLIELSRLHEELDDFTRRFRGISGSALASRDASGLLSKLLRYIRAWEKYSDLVSAIVRLENAPSA